VAGRAVIVTGAFGNLGAAVAELLRARGDRLVLIDSAAHAPADFAARFNDHLVLGGTNLGDWAQAQSAMARAAGRGEPIGGLVNVAGGFTWARIDEGDPALWQRMFDTNLKTAMHASKAVLPYLGQGGHIVNIGANAAGRAALGMGAYAASKAAVLRMTEALADELKDRRITVNAVLPGIIDTPANRAAMPEADAARWVSPQSVAQVIAFLLSDAARDVTGAGIPVTGRI